MEYTTTLYSPQNIFYSIATGSLLPRLSGHYSSCIEKTSSVIQLSNAKARCISGPSIMRHIAIFTKGRKKLSGSDFDLMLISTRGW